MIFSFIPFPEDIGLDTILEIMIAGRAVDINGNPVEIPFSVAINRGVTKYKETIQLDGLPQTITPSVDGSWSIILADTSGMTPDAYYQWDLNGEKFRKSVEDFPLNQEFNSLEDYQ